SPQPKARPLVQTALSYSGGGAGGAKSDIFTLWIKKHLVVPCYGLSTASLNRKRTRDMSFAGWGLAIGCGAESLQNPAQRRRSHAAAVVPQRPKLTLQPLQFRKYALSRGRYGCPEGR